MQRHSDEALVAYIDGELDDDERRHVEAWLEADPAVRDRLTGLVQSGDLLRGAFADIVDEPVPSRLMAAARGASGTAPPEAEILVLKRPGWAAITLPARRWQIGLAAAAGLFGVIFGGVGTYLGMGLLNPANPAAERRLAAAAANGSWLDNAAGYYKLTVSAGDNMLIDVPASNDPREALQKICLCHRQQGDRPTDPGHRRIETVRYLADLRPPAGRQHALLAASGTRLRARRPDRHRLSLGDRQRRGLAARRDLIAIGQQMRSLIRRSRRASGHQGSRTPRPPRCGSRSSAACRQPGRRSG